MPGIRLTDMQSKAVALLVEGFLLHPLLVEISPPLTVQLRVVQGIIDNDDSFESYEFDLLVALMDLFFESCDEDIEIWPGLEQAYAKLKGHWPYDAAWYTRARNNPHLIGVYDRPNSR